MTQERVSASTVIAATPDVVFDVLVDPATHAAIDGTGRVRGPVDREPLTAAGQVFRMGMYHEDHPDGCYETVNRVGVLERPTAVSWETGYDPGDGDLRFGGWSWRYDLAPAEPGLTRVTLSYDWSAVPDSIRVYLHFPPFPAHHLDRSLARLAELVTGESSSDAVRTRGPDRTGRCRVPCCAPLPSPGLPSGSPAGTDAGAQGPRSGRRTRPSERVGGPAEA